MKVDFKTLEFSNFMSYGKIKTVIDLQKTGTTLILGEDLDNTTNGQSSNGTGKTTVMNALTYAIFDKPISDVNVDDLVNNVNGKHLEVSVEFEKNGSLYKIVRRRKAGKSGRENTVNLFIDGKDMTRDSIKRTDSAIQDIIGMPYDMFVRIVVISANHTPFLDMPVNSHYQSNQTDFIERLFNLTVLSEQAVMLKDAIKSVEDSMNTHKVRIEFLEKEHARYADQVQAAKVRIINWDTTNANTISEYRQKLQDADSVDVREEQRLHKELETTEKRLKEVMQEKKQLKQFVQKYEKMLANSTHELSHLTEQKCPYCLQQYADADTKMEQCRSVIADSETKHRDFSHELGLIEEDEKDLNALVKLIRKQKNVSNIEELLEIIAQRQTIEQKITDLSSTENPFHEPYNDLVASPIEPIDYTDVNDLKRLQDHQQFLLKLLTKKDSFVRKTLLNKYLPFLNGRLHHYLAQLGLTHKVEFTHEMTASISLFGRTIKFGNLSNGQRARVNLALALSFRDVLQKLHNPINLCLLDESLDFGLDEVGIQAAARMLKRKARDEEMNIFIISHREGLNSVFDRTMTVQMQKGFSSIREAGD